MKYEVKKKQKGIIPTIGSKYYLLFRMVGNDWTIINTPLTWLDITMFINDIKDFIDGILDSNQKVKNIVASTDPNNEHVIIDIFNDNEKISYCKFKFEDYGSEPEDE